MEKYLWFDGKRFTRDEKTGYYLNSSIRKRMHNYVWEYYNGEIPKGYEVHHIDHDRSNNDISNLELLTVSEHRKRHAEELTNDQREWFRNNLDEKARPKAIEWHKSEEGRRWHKEHYIKYGEAIHVKSEKVCANCGKSFMGDPKAIYCSNACKSAHRRKKGVDNVEAICVVCGKEFMTNKYRNSETCSKSCASMLAYSRRNESKSSKEDQ